MSGCASTAKNQKAGDELEGVDAGERQFRAQ